MKKRKGPQRRNPRKTEATKRRGSIRIGIGVGIPFFQDWSAGGIPTNGITLNDLTTGVTTTGGIQLVTG